MWRAGIAFLAAIVVGVVAIACGGGSAGGGGGAQMGLVTTTISDPATCQAPNGPYSHVYVTVTDVKASTSSTASDSDSSAWTDLTPNLSAAPVQVDLLGLPNNNCFLAMLGSQTQIPAGNYQQIRIILLDNNHGNTVTGNKCQGNDANCVELAADNSIHTLLLSSEAQTGIKIPSGQIAGGQFTVASGSTADLDIDFNACASIVIQGNGQYRLMPVLHAGEVSVQSSSISGKVVISGTPNAISGGKTVVALEQKDASGIDRVVMETVPDASGNFTFCPVPSGTYDVVAAAIDGAGVAYAATVTTGVSPGNALGNIPMLPTTGTNTGPTTITGKVTTSTGSAATAANIRLAALQSIAGGTMVTVPLAAQSSATASLTTASGGSCPVNTDCVSYTVEVPGVNANVGAVGGPYMQGTTTPVAFTMDALASTISPSGNPDCTPPEQQTTAITVTPGATPSAPDLVFSGCQ